MRRTLLCMRKKCTAATPRYLKKNIILERIIIIYKPASFIKVAGIGVRYRIYMKKMCG
jgi:hypothetical protein